MLEFRAPIGKGLECAYQRGCKGHAAGHDLTAEGHDAFAECLDFFFSLVQTANQLAIVAEKLDKGPAGSNTRSGWHFL